MQCPYLDKPHDCCAIEIYRQFGIFYPDPCVKHCNQMRIKELEEKIRRNENMLFENDCSNGKIKIEQNTAGDSRGALRVPTIEEFGHANESHREDVKNLINRFCWYLKRNASRHDWSKVEEPYRSMFYNDLCNAINKQMEFKSGEWAKLHYGKLERHHLNRVCPEDVNLFDVIEMMCDCIAAGYARNGEVYPIEISPDILTKAFNNTVELMKNEVEVVDKNGIAVKDKEIPLRPGSGPSFHGESWQTCPRCGKSFEYWDTVHESGFTHIRDKIYQHDECGQYIDMT